MKRSAGATPSSRSTLRLGKLPPAWLDRPVPFSWVAQGEIVKALRSWAGYGAVARRSITS